MLSTVSGTASAEHMTAAGLLVLGRLGGPWSGSFLMLSISSSPAQVGVHGEMTDRDLKRWGGSGLEQMCQLPDERLFAGSTSISRRRK